jgi:hypothetical protein
VKGRSGESVKQIKESREMQGRKKLKVNIGIYEISTRNLKIPASMKT